MEAEGMTPAEAVRHAPGTVEAALRRAKYYRLALEATAHAYALTQYAKEYSEFFAYGKQLNAKARRDMLAKLAMVTGRVEALLQAVEEMP